MVKVITYGTYDLLHQGHINLLKRAKELGDYLIVGVTADDFDKKRGKINVHQTLMERIEAVRETGYADEIIIEEYEGQKIDDIKRFGVDIFTVGSDWIGKFDYLNEYCKVIYLDRTKGISSSELRTKNRTINLGIIGNNKLLEKYINESEFVNGLEITSLYTRDKNFLEYFDRDKITEYTEIEKFIENIDAVYVVSNPKNHFEDIKFALKNGKHVLCESPLTLTKEDCEYLHNLASEKNLIFMEAIKTAYSTAFNRLLLLVKSGYIGDIISIDATCTSLKELNETPKEEILTKQNSLCAWGPTALLPIFMLLGTNYKRHHFSTYYLDKENNFDLFTKIDFTYPNAVATAKVGKGIKSEGELIISGTKGYVYVPAPWWKTDYFEIRFEDETNNKRYFYQLDGEGIRYQLLTFIKSIEKQKSTSYIDKNISIEIANIIEKFNNKEELDEIILGNEG